MRLSDCKREARYRIKTRKLRLFRITAGIAAIAILFGFAAYCLPMLLTGREHAVYVNFVSQLALLLVSCGLLGAMRLGRTAWLYCCACGREPSAVQFLYWLRRGRGFRAAALYLQIRIRKMFWTILLCVPAVVLAVCGLHSARFDSALIRYFVWGASAISLGLGLFFAAWIGQKYALAPILLARSPQKGVRSAVRGSCSLMEESCTRLLRLKLSFLPWALLCACILPTVYVVPYYQQATSCMLRDILRAHTI